MTERRLRFFAMPQEFDDLVWPAAAAVGAWLVPWLPITDELPFAIVPDASIAAEGGYERVHLSGRSEASRAPGIGRLVAPAAEGWITLELPEVRHGVLFISQITAYSGRWTAGDAGNETTMEILRLFRTVTKPIRPRLRYPTWAENFVYGGAGTNRAIGYTDGAAGLERAGGMLMTRESHNVRFSTRPIEGKSP